MDKTKLSLHFGQGQAKQVEMNKVILTVVLSGFDAGDEV